jgi:hypothetical protein
MESTAFWDLIFYVMDVYRRFGQRYYGIVHGQRISQLSGIILLDYFAKSSALNIWGSMFLRKYRKFYQTTRYHIKKET